MRNVQTAALCDVEPSSVQDAFPCTPLQAGLLALVAQSPGHYVARKVLKLRETTDVDQLAMAWAEVVATTPILRTRGEVHLSAIRFSSRDPNGLP
jgi:hypothetical protein